MVICHARTPAANRKILITFRVMRFPFELFHLISIYSARNPHTAKFKMCTWTQACHIFNYGLSLIFLVFIFTLAGTLLLLFIGCCCCCCCSALFHHQSAETKRVDMMMVWLITYTAHNASWGAKQATIFIWLIIMIAMKIMTMNSQTVPHTQVNVK